MTFPMKWSMHARKHGQKCVVHILSRISRKCRVWYSWWCFLFCGICFLWSYKFKLKTFLLNTIQIHVMFSLMNYYKAEWPISGARIFQPHQKPPICPFQSQAFPPPQELPLCLLVFWGVGTFYGLTSLLFIVLSSKCASLNTMAWF